MPEAEELKAGSEDWEPFDVGTVKWLRNDARSRSGIWRCRASDQPDAHEVEFEHDETIHVLKGRARVEVIDGPTVELRVGDSAAFYKGTVGRWTLLEDFEEFFVYH